MIQPPLVRGSSRTRVSPELKICILSFVSQWLEKNLRCSAEADLMRNRSVNPLVESFHLRFIIYAEFKNISSIASIGYVTIVIQTQILDCLKAESRYVSLSLKIMALRIASVVNNLDAIDTNT